MRELKIADTKEVAEYIVNRNADRLGIDRVVALANALLFAFLVGVMENNNRVTGKNPTSSAKGLYQFINASVPPARVRLQRYGYDVSSDNPNLMTREEQTALFLANILEMKGSDKYMRKVLAGGKPDDMMEAYLVLHHTDPDKATLDRAREVFYGALHKNR